ncbi:MAG TPA: bacteriohopanetetrol glucosamine biosynthesis glycosyltransferase HpnI [Casimicrobiaceae bacterium]|nr:bacteriohopanetetrol glucosamine biosynthesis glycosyltransferase HpnI [Casimicrobiaceae bacterium]
MLSADTVLHAIGLACFVLAGCGCIHALAAAFLVRRFRTEHVPELAAFPSVTILKPVHGTEAGLYENLSSFCDQDYPGETQIVFGVHDPLDPAVLVIERLIAARSDKHLELRVTSASRGANPKVANLLGMEAWIRHEIVVIADSDIAVPRDYLSRTVAALGRPDVGLVTYLYRGDVRGGVWARLAAMAIDYQFLPNVLVGLAAGLARPCFGATMAMKRETLAAIGGFDAFLSHLADDNAIGEAVRKAGLIVWIPQLVLSHTCAERNIGELLRHELRWARTLRAASPLGYAGLVMTHPLPFAVLGSLLAGQPLISAGMIAAALACRLVLQVQVDDTLGIRSNAWLGPVRDLLAFGIHFASFFVGVVSWRGHRYKVRADGTLVPLGEHRS